MRMIVVEEVDGLVGGDHEFAGIDGGDVRELGVERAIEVAGRVGVRIGSINLDGDRDFRVEADALDHG